RSRVKGECALRTCAADDTNAFTSADTSFMQKEVTDKAEGSPRSNPGLPLVHFGADLAVAEFAEQWRDPPERDAAVLPLGRLRLDLQILLAVALRNKVLHRNTELIDEYVSNRLCTMIGQRQVILIAADRIRVSLDEEHLGLIAVEHPLD